MAISTLTGNVKSIGIMAIVLAVVLAIVQGVQNAGVVSGTANDSITSFITALGSFGDWIAIIVIAIIGFYLMGLFDKR